jgi:hypothetical protein
MSEEIFEPGSAILYMKIGEHAQESLPDIIRRKKIEIERAGFGMWGYGGNTCHPRTMVQPFAYAHSGSDEPILLCMQPMTSKHLALPLRAEEYSSDGTTWEQVPQDINVRGSRYALCIRNLREVDASLQLADTRVAIGNSKGKLGSEYVRGRVDKACLEVVEHYGESQSIVRIGLIAELIKPYAVFLR